VDGTVYDQNAPAVTFIYADDLLLHRRDMTSKRFWRDTDLLIVLTVGTDLVVIKTTFSL